MSNGIVEVDFCDLSEAKTKIFSDFQPKILRGAVSHWPLVKQATRSDEDLARYLLRYYNGENLECWVADPSLHGRYFYNSELNGFNFERTSSRLDKVLELLLNPHSVAKVPSIYVGSTSIAYCLPGISEENVLPILSNSIVPNIWLGNKSRIAPHFDVSDNIACVCAGKRCFTLFPPEQARNLYFGPLDISPAGQPISMVNLDQVDYERFPGFAEAEKNAITANLEAGDALYIPSMWIHSVKSLSDVNVLINYWWDDSIRETGSPYEAMLHSILAISQLNPERKRAWKSVFEHFVFQENGYPAEHLPEKNRGPLGAMSPDLARYVKNYLLSVMTKNIRQ